MSKHNLLETSTANLNDIFSNGLRYQVPIYQRDYSWEEKHWEDLWTDILAVRDSDRVHYMGALVLQDYESKSYYVIDGQQRLATLSIIALAVVNRIQDLIDSDVDVEENLERKELLTSLYVGAKDGVSLRYSNKLKLNENNESFYSSFLVQLRKPINKHKLSLSEKKLNQAYEYFYEKLKVLLGENPNGEDLADLIQNQIAEKLVFIKIVVEDELSAYTVFETLNERGVDLSISDLLKNYLLSLTSQSRQDEEQAKEQWKRIIRFTNLREFPVFLRYYWISRREFVRKDSLFRALRNSVTSAQEAFDLLDDLERYVAVYAALKNPNDELWLSSKEIRQKITQLKLFKVRQAFPLLLVSYFKFQDNPTEFEKILRFCVIIAFRYNVIGSLNPNKQEQTFHRVAKRLHDDKINNSSQIAKELEGIYVSDEEFATSFSRKRFDKSSQKKLIRYILYSLENKISGTEKDFETDSGTIEHILPENPPEEWGNAFSQNEQTDYIYRLGNLTLLKRSENNECGTEIFEKKKETFENTTYELTQKLADYNEWTATQLNTRQESLAKTATSIWRIPQLS